MIPHDAYVVVMADVVDAYVTRCPDCSFAVRWPTRDDAERSAAEHREAPGG